MASNSGKASAHRPRKRPTAGECSLAIALHRAGLHEVGVTVFFNESYLSNIRRLGVKKCRAWREKQKLKTQADTR